MALPVMENTVLTAVTGGAALGQTSSCGLNVPPSFRIFRPPPMVLSPLLFHFPSMFSYIYSLFVVVFNPARGSGERCNFVI